MSRTAEWRPLAIAMAEWALEKIGPKKLWSYVDGKSSLRDIGFTASAVKQVSALRCLVPTGKEKQVGNRIYYMFHNAAEPRPRKICWGEWPLEIPKRPEWEVAVPIVGFEEIIEEVSVKFDPLRSFSDDVLRMVVEKQGNRCFYCRFEFDSEHPPVGDHATPYSEGGRTDYWNCIAAHSPCNLKRGKRHIAEAQSTMMKDFSRGRSAWT